MGRVPTCTLPSIGRLLPSALRAINILPLLPTPEHITKETFEALKADLTIKFNEIDLTISKQVAEQVSKARDAITTLTQDIHNTLKDHSARLQTKMDSKDIQMEPFSNAMASLSEQLSSIEKGHQEVARS